MTKILCITSDVDPDWNGSWKKAEVEQEMKEVYNEPTSDTDWICWILDHVFDCKDFTEDIEKVICNEAFVNGTFRLQGQLVTIVKA